MHSLVKPLAISLTLHLVSIPLLGAYLGHTHPTTKQEQPKIIAHVKLIKEPPKPKPIVKPKPKPRPKPKPIVRPKPKPKPIVKPKPKPVVKPKPKPVVKPKKPRVIQPKRKPKKRKVTPKRRTRVKPKRTPRTKPVTRRRAPVVEPKPRPITPPPAVEPTPTPSSPQTGRVLTGLKKQGPSTSPAARPSEGRNTDDASYSPSHPENPNPGGLGQTPQKPEPKPQPKPRPKPKPKPQPKPKPKPKPPPPPPPPPEPAPKAKGRKGGEPGGVAMNDSISLPARLRKESFQGDIQLKVIIQTDGSAQFSILRGSGNPDIDAYILQRVQSEAQATPKTDAQGNPKKTVLRVRVKVHVD